MSRDTFYDELKRKRTEELYQKEFDEELARILASKKAGTDTPSYFDSDYMKEIDDYERPASYKIEDDDKHHTKGWNALLTDCAFYYDHPSVEDKLSTKNKLQLRYDSLFASSWRPPLSNRHDLLLWACTQKNEAMDATENPAERDTCEYSTLVTRYGPNYAPIKEKLGYMKGLFDGTEFS